MPKSHDLRSHKMSPASFRIGFPKLWVHVLVLEKRILNLPITYHVILLTQEIEQFWLCHFLGIGLHLRDVGHIHMGSRDNTNQRYRINLIQSIP